MQQQLLRGRACSTVLVLLAAAATSAAAKDAGIQITPNMKMQVKQLSMDDLPKPSNPYAGKAYAGCEGGYCTSADAELEAQFWRAAGKGKAKAVKKLLANEALNITRNIVPDSEGFARVVDVAVWTASANGHVDVMKVLLKHPGVKDLYKYEDGHTLDLAAMAGHKAMVQLLLQEEMPVGPSAMAHAAHYNHSDIMGVSGTWQLSTCSVAAAKRRKPRGDQALRAAAVHDRAAHGNSQ
eukprot:GHRQ01016018.1.p1 GENE.GHRQ01016018.1~~GHRQ01016018.1.p1  ORF type:complete len:238 (+),score=95.02 GHRQ01016018.1:291-1004(+)